MRLAAFTDYGLRVLMRLAATPDESLTTARIAEEFEVPYNHLAKVVQDLARGGFVSTQRGAKGGIRLAQNAKSIRLGDATRYLEQKYAMVECFRSDGGCCVLTPRCRLRSHLASAYEAFLESLNKTSIADCAWMPGAVSASGGGAGAVAVTGAGGKSLRGSGEAA